MKRKSAGKSTRTKPPALRALQRAARKAVEEAKRTGTPAYVLRGDEVVDIADSTNRARKFQ